MSRKKDIKERPNVIAFKQNVSPRLLGIEENKPKQEKPKTIRRNTGIKPKKAEPVPQQPIPQKEESRRTFALRYGVSYLDRLEKLFLSERSKGRKVTKAALVEEALDLLFEKYNNI